MNEHFRKRTTFFDVSAFCFSLSNPQVELLLPRHRIYWSVTYAHVSLSTSAQPGTCVSVRALRSCQCFTEAVGDVTNTFKVATCELLVLRTNEKQLNELRSGIFYLMLQL